jgi:hypothetical protein
MNDAGGSNISTGAAILLGNGDAEEAHISKLPKERLVESVGTEGHKLFNKKRRAQGFHYIMINTRKIPHTALPLVSVEVISLRVDLGLRKCSDSLSQVRVDWGWLK